MRFCRFLFFVVFFFIVSCSNKIVFHQKNDESNFSPDSDVVKNKPQKPNADFFKTTAKDYLIFQFKGLLNSNEDVKNGEATAGLGKFEFNFNKEKYQPKSDFFAYLYEVPDDFPNNGLNMAGNDYVVFYSYDGPKKNIKMENGNVQYLYDFITLGIKKQKFLTALSSKRNIFYFSPEEEWINLEKYIAVVRKDNKIFAKYCFKAFPNRNFVTSKYFIDTSLNEDFSFGETVQIWGNVAMNNQINEDFKGYEDNYCEFFDDKKRISLDEFYKSIAKNGTEFGCEIPDNFFDSTSKQRATFKFSGVINKRGETKTGESKISKIVLNDEVFNKFDYKVYAGQTVLSGKSYLFAQFIGDFKTISSTYSKYKDVTVYISKDVAKNLKKDENQISFDNYNFNLIYSNSEYKIDGTNEYIKTCPIAILDKKKSNKLFVCHKNNKNFSSGEILQFATNITLTQENSAKKELFPNDCFCYNLNSNATISCDGFEAMK